MLSLEKTIQSWFPNFFRSQYKNRLLTTINLGCLTHFSFITICKHWSTPSISLLPLTSMAITDGAPPFNNCSHNEFRDDISFALRTLQSANVHCGNLRTVIQIEIHYEVKPIVCTLSIKLTSHLLCLSTLLIYQHPNMKLCRLLYALVVAPQPWWADVSPCGQVRSDRNPSAKPEGRHLHLP